MMAEVLPIETPTLGDRSYLVHDGEVAAVIDPQRDTDRITALAGRNGVRITHVAETHIHNDYVSGGLALSRATDAAYLVNGADPVRFDRQPVGDGDVIQVGAASPVAGGGHARPHLQPPVLRTGGGGARWPGCSPEGRCCSARLAGRTCSARTTPRRWPARSTPRRGDWPGELPDSAPVFPTHGFGSFCAATQTQAAASTIGREKQVNPALTLGEDAYVKALLAGLDAYPAYYAHMGPANLAGPGQVDLSPPERADPDQIRRRIAAGEWVVDLRDRVAFAAGFVPGSFCFSLDGSFASYLGWVLPWGTRLTLLGETPRQVAQAQRELVRIGIDRPAATATGRPEQWSGGQPLAAMRLATFGDLAAADRENAVVLDVRRPLEWASGHVAGAVHIPFHELPRRAGEIPPGQVWVYCRTGYRSTVAASILAAAGRQVISIDDEFGHAEGAGLSLTRNDGQSKETMR